MSTELTRLPRLMPGAAGDATIFATRIERVYTEVNETASSSGGRVEVRLYALKILASTYSSGGGRAAAPTILAMARIPTLILKNTHLNHLELTG